MLLGSGEKEILISKRQRAWVNCACVLMFYDQSTLRGWKLDVQLKKMLNKVLEEQFGSSWLLMVKYEKRRKKWVENGIVKQNEWELKIWQILSLSTLEEMWKVHWKENTKGVTHLLFDKEIRVDENHRFNHPSQQKPGLEMGLYQQIPWQLGLMETQSETEWRKTVKVSCPSRKGKENPKGDLETIWATV